jgi:chromosomal replication initiation ATPase DnaA
MKVDNILVYDIFDLVSAGESQPLDMIKSKSQKQELVLCRQLIVYLIKIIAYPNMSLCTVGSYINKDHATVIHSIKTVRNRVSTERVLAARVHEYETMVRLMKPSVMIAYCTEELHLIEFQN